MASFYKDHRMVISCSVEKPCEDLEIMLVDKGCNGFLLAQLCVIKVEEEGSAIKVVINFDSFGPRGFCIYAMILVVWAWHHLLSELGFQLDVLASSGRKHFHGCTCQVGFRLVSRCGALTFGRCRYLPSG